VCTASCDLTVKNRPEDDYLLVETCSLHITLCNKNSCADVQISITICIHALRDVFIQISHLVVLGPTTVRDVFYASEQMLFCSEDRAHDCAINLFMGSYYYL